MHAKYYLYILSRENLCRDSKKGKFLAVFQFSFSFDFFFSFLLSLQFFCTKEAYKFLLFKGVGRLRLFLIQVQMFH